MVMKQGRSQNQANTRSAGQFQTHQDDQGLYKWNNKNTKLQ